MFIRKMSEMMTRRDMVVPMYGQNYDDCSSCTSSTCMTDEDEECIKSLLTLKHRSVTAEQLCCETSGSPQRRNEAQSQLVNFDSHVRSRSVSTGSVNDFTEDGKNDGSRFVATTRPPSMPLSHPDDMYWLSDLQCYVRSFCTEFFSASEADVTSMGPSSHSRSAKKPTSGPGSGGRRGPITLGRVGIRCVFCRDAHPSTRASQATSFPSQISGIYGAVVMMQCRHFPHCKSMPQQVREKIAGLKRGGNSAPTHIMHMDRSAGTNGRQQYWADSAKRLGLIDTEHGVRFKSEHSVSAPAFTPRVSPDLSSHRASASVISEVALPASIDHLVKDSCLVSLDDKDLVPDYLFLAMAQMKPCNLTEEDKVGCYKTRHIGFKGMCCKHCGGQPGFGKYFPATVRSLAQTTTSQTILKHIGAKCRMCPEEVRNAVNALLQESQKDANKAPPSKPCSNSQDGRPRYGSRKVFFQRVWGRLHGDYVPELPSQTMLDPSASTSSLNTSSSSLQEIPFSKSERQVISPHEEVSSLGSNDERSSSSEDDSVIGDRPARFYGEEDSDDDSDTSADCLLDNQNRRITIRTSSSRPHVVSAPKQKKRKTNHLTSLQ